MCRYQDARIIKKSLSLLAIQASVLLWFCCRIVMSSAIWSFWSRDIANVLSTWVTLLGVEIYSSVIHIGRGEGTSCKQLFEFKL